MSKGPTIGFRLPQDVHDWVVGLASKEGLSAGQYVRRATERSFEKAKGKFETNETSVRMEPPAQLGPVSRPSDFLGVPIVDSSDIPPTVQSLGVKTCRHWHKTLLLGKMTCTDCGELA